MLLHVQVNVAASLSAGQCSVQRSHAAIVFTQWSKIGLFALQGDIMPEKSEIWQRGVDQKSAPPAKYQVYCRDLRIRNFRSNQISNRIGG